MAIINKKMITVDLLKGTLFRNYQNVNLGEGDSNAEEMGALVYSDGAPADLSGASCIGYFIRPDGITLILAGNISGNRATVTLPSAAYAVPGKFTLTIKIYGGNVTNTLCIFDGTVCDTTTGYVYDEASLIPTVEELQALIADAEAAAEDLAETLTVTASNITGNRYKISVVNNRS